MRPWGRSRQSRRLSGRLLVGAASSLNRWREQCGLSSRKGQGRFAFSTGASLYRFVSVDDRLGFWCGPCRRLGDEEVGSTTTSHPCWRYASCAEFFVWLRRGGWPCLFRSWRSTFVLGRLPRWTLLGSCIYPAAGCQYRPGQLRAEGVGTWLSGVGVIKNPAYRSPGRCAINGVQFGLG